MARDLADVLKERGLEVRTQTCRVDFRSVFYAKLLTLMPNVLAWCGVSSFEDLRPFLTEEAYARLFAIKPEYVISTGSLTAAVNDRFAVDRG